MLGENRSNVGVPVFYDANLLQYTSNTSNQLQFFGNAPVGSTVADVHCIGGEHNNPIYRPNKRGHEAISTTRQQTLQISLNHNICHESADQTAPNPNKSYVSTGLKLSYEDDERNSSTTLVPGNMFAAPSVLSSLGDNFRTEFDRQNEEIDHYIKTQEEHLIKEVRDMKRRHIASFVTAIEEGVNKIMCDKDIEIEIINCKNRELVERIKQVASEAQNWQYRAKYNESVVNSLKSNLQRALSRGADQTKEGFGDSEIEDTASCVDPCNYIGNVCGTRKDFNVFTNCRVCKVKEVRVLLMPCRHLCLCIDCEGLVAVCPVCQLMKIASIQVDMS